MNKILVLSNTASMQYQFLLPHVLQLRELGYEVHIGCNFKEGINCSEERIERFCRELDALGIPYHQIDFTRNVMLVHKLRRPIRQIEAIVREGGFTAIHCHSPAGGVCGRVVGHRLGIQVLYTAHGFHFFSGSPLLGWMLFYPAERMLAHWTDTLITINQEDFRRAQSFRAGAVYHISGAGVALERYRHAERPAAQLRRELGIPEDAVVFLSIGELNKNKNHIVLIRALHRLNDPSLHLVLTGVDHLGGRLQAQAKKYGLAGQVHFTGFREDIPELLHAADVFCFPSKREGLGFTAIEAMAAGLPLITSDRHGIRDYSVDGVTGFVRHPDDVKGFAEAMRLLADDPLRRRAMGLHNAQAAEQFALAPVLGQMEEIYASVLPDAVRERV